MLKGLITGDMEDISTIFSKCSGCTRSSNNMCKGQSLDTGKRLLWFRRERYGGRIAYLANINHRNIRQEITFWMLQPLLLRTVDNTDDSVFNHSIFECFAIPLVDRSGNILPFRADP